MKYKAVIFDMDGTIVDTQKIWTKTDQILIERRGFAYTPTLSAELNARTHGLAMHKSCSVIKEILGLQESVEELAREGHAVALSLYKQGITFIDGFKEFHKHIGTLQLHKAIATNSDDSTIKATDEAVDLKSFFGKHIYGISVVGFTCKPDPAIYMHTATQLGVEPHECIAIEDSAFGIAAAQNAGMFCIGINTGGDYEAIKKAHAIVDHYREIDLKKLSRS